MRIRKFHLDRVRGLPSIDLDFVDRATGKVRSRTVIAGSNGTGKSTVLDTIYALAGFVYGDQDHGPPGWLGESWDALAWMRVGDPPIPTSDKRDLLLYFLDHDSMPPKFHHFRDVHDAVVYGWTGWPHGGPGYGPDESLAILGLRSRIEEAERAAKRAEGLPNLLYFPSEQRELQPKSKGQIMGGEDAYRWIYRFSDSRKWEGSLESFLVALDYRDLMAKRNGDPDTDRFQRLVKVVNAFLQGKQILDVEEMSLRVRVKPDNGDPFSIDSLSAGEKQILLLLGEIQRRICQGSIVLIDEPEIHLHPRWQRLLIRALADLCAEHDAQLIVTTHSEEVANAVYEHELILLDAVFAR
jgi:predicted ATPase